MRVIHLIPALATTIVATAYINQYFKESYSHSDIDKAVAVLIGCFAGAVYPLVWVGAAIYLTSEKIRKELLEGDDQ